MIKPLIFNLSLLLFWFTAASAEDVKVEFGPKSVGLNETFSIEFTTPHNINEQPDFSPLQSSFEILSSSHGVSATFSNGVVSQESRWNLSLKGKHEGQLTIPPIQFGPYTSSPQTIEVTQSRTPAQDDAIFLETAIQPSDSAFEQTQLIYTVRLYCSVKIAQAALSELTTNDPDAIIERLGGDSQYEHVHTNGTRYLVIERKYVISPQRVGELVFSPIVFQGQIIKGRQSIFELKTQFTEIASKEEKIEIKPIPAPFQKNNWFAANQVTLSEEWSSDPEKIIVGEPITWTLKLTAQGCPGNQIPDIQLQMPNDLKYYLDKPDITNQTGAEGFIGTKQIKIALIATKSGSFILPAINIKWWNLKTNQIQEVQLPEKKIIVENGAIALAEPNLLQSTIKNENSTELPYWIWILIAVNLTIFLIAYLFFFRKNTPNSSSPETLKQIRKQVKIACMENQAKQAETYLLAWGRLIFPELKASSLMGLKSSLPLSFQQAIDDLNQHLYGAQSNWKGEALERAFSTFIPDNGKEKQSKNQHLRSLYPN